MQLNRPIFLNYDSGDFSSIDPKFDIVELKFDGWWGQLLIDRDRWEIYSRSGELKKFGTFTGSLHGSPVARTLLHGEFVFGTEWAKDHPSLYEKLVLFGVTEMYGSDVRSMSNSCQRKLIADFLGNHPEQDIVKRCMITDQYPVEESQRLWGREVVVEGYEGLVFKSTTAPWGAEFGRMKREVTMDYVCTGFLDSDSDTYAGWGVASILGGLYVGGTLTKVCKVSGLTEELRREFFDHPDRYIGKVFEAKGKKISKRGALRHPNFVRWRTDKVAEDCVW